MSELTDAIRERYAAKALRMVERERYAGCATLAAASDCCEDDCCAGAYGAAELAAVGLDASASLGCGNPTLLADLRPGERVLDLGSGAGIDVLLSARRVAPSGHAFGVDMTDQMLAVARANQQRAGVANATFLKGTIEAVPLPDASVDVVISNCVINLAADKGAVLREAHRVLRPGGRFAVADMIALAALPPEVKSSLDEWAGCVAGTISLEEYTDALRAAGFTGVDIEVTREVRLAHVDAAIASAYLRARKPLRVFGALELACGLDAVEREARSAEWAEIEAALVTRTEGDGTVIATYRNTSAVRDALERLVAAERECCPGATWSTVTEDELIRLEIREN